METPAISHTTTPGKPPAKFIGYVHNFRGIAMMYIVAAHVLVQWPEHSTVHKILVLLFQNSTIFFMFISGFLFQHLGHKFEYRDYLKRKFQYVICPYLVLSVPLILYRVYSADVPGFTTDEHPDFLSWPRWEQAGYYLLHGAHLQQLWFIPVITLYYLISPLLLQIDKHPRLYYLLIPLMAISLIWQRSVLSDTLVMAVHFLSVYVAGMFTGRYRDKVLAFADSHRTLITLLPFVFMVITYFSPAWLYDRADFLQKILFCIFFLYWLYRFDTRVPQWIGTIAVLSFGIYYIHYFFVLFLRGVSLKLYHQEIPGNLLTWTLSYVFIMVASVVTLKVIKRILGKYSRYIVGY
ncbi:acyltransferase [Chitinophaga oryzae]|uniref:Acyltransferase n=1 Tax=Chitinophaga oryzae TaxID=2725414 RepID=A0AAE6ZDP9_9BACT|nr:acyltransferase [Chitinophaga oryzae]QJB31041.1 acyltransferase [Chitinophaga oryzae]QJB37525.1 acyltransferase [Chitinophaga oryzae]